MSWIACDIETTGLDPDLHDVWEVALVDETGASWSTLIADVHVGTADGYALEVGGFYRRWDDPNGDTKTSAAVAAAEVARRTAGKHLVGVNPTFDAQFLSRLLRRNNRAPAWHYHLVDLGPMALGWLHGQARAAIELAAEVGEAQLAGTRAWTAAEENLGLPWKSYQLSQACGVDPPSDDEKHTALGDAMWAYRWFRTLTGEVLP